MLCYTDSMLNEKPPTQSQVQPAETPETQARNEPAIEDLINCLKEIFGNTKEKGWIQFEESKDPTGESEENYRVMAFWVPEEEIATYETLMESPDFGFEKDEEYNNPDKFPEPGKYTRFTFPKYSFGVKKPDDGFMMFRVGFNV